MVFTILFCYIIFANIEFTSNLLIYFDKILVVKSYKGLATVEPSNALSRKVAICGTPWTKLAIKNITAMNTKDFANPKINPNNLSKPLNAGLSFFRASKIFERIKIAKDENKDDNKC